MATAGPISREGVVAAVLAFFFSGCASTRPHEAIPPGLTAFEQVGIIDFRHHTIEDYRRLVRPGDLIVNYMRPGRAAKKREWLFAILPHGHSMIVMDPADEQRGLFECRFRGCRYVGRAELELYSYNTIYRLRDAHRLDLDRLRDFADHATQFCRRYSFKSWIALNGNLQPEMPGDISSGYTCSTMVAAAYHYAGATLDVSFERHRVITPLSIAASLGRFNDRALPPDRLAEITDHRSAMGTNSVPPASSP